MKRSLVKGSCVTSDFCWRCPVTYCLELLEGPKTQQYSLITLVCYAVRPVGISPLGATQEQVHCSGTWHSLNNNFIHQSWWVGDFCYSPCHLVVYSYLKEWFTTLLN
ncbi:hypothetical protein O3P69_006044 [Scylla paramamosain]|uniref:Uncharacterized protein n=1 Tax=Scylla paramamosain TaxID=85552 RepID=A0AAW0U4M6_SCYPA